jgi:hypothetical protein
MTSLSSTFCLRTGLAQALRSAEGPEPLPLTLADTQEFDAGTPRLR